LADVDDGAVVKRVNWVYTRGGGEVDHAHAVFVAGFAGCVDRGSFPKITPEEALDPRTAEFSIPMQVSVIHLTCALPTVLEVSTAEDVLYDCLR
jgi:hypothetical protein